MLPLGIAWPGPSIFIVKASQEAMTHRTSFPKPRGAGEHLARQQQKANSRVDRFRSIPPERGPWGCPEVRSFGERLGWMSRPLTRGPSRGQPRTRAEESQAGRAERAGSPQPPALTCASLRETGCRSRCGRLGARAPAPPAQPHSRLGHVSRRRGNGHATRARTRLGQPAPS